MSSRALHALNLNSLVALDALLAECNVTRAARRVGITQPAMSQTLARLRELFDDPILVRSGRGMKRSPRADAMLAPLAEALQAVEHAVQLGMRFDPQSSSRVFRVAMTDLHLALTLPEVLRTIAKVAPGVRVEAQAITMRGLSERIAAGVIDLALGFLLSVGEKLHSEELMAETYICLVRKGHPLAKKKRVGLADYAKHHHIANTPVEFVPVGMSGISPRLGARGGIRAALPSLLAVPSVVRHTDLVATVPRSTLAAPVDFTNVVAVDAPKELPDAVHSIWWHDRFDRDPAHEWLRGVVRQAAPVTLQPGGR
ncbi:MAG: LysR family transcriptional regulator [Myxococcales bacterium]|nr:LysR family transcriptional regulator [Myxococcales bacterium]MCB9630229.1 LysR family transcriptional regulator [Sandaracinaceae bacterium]